MCDSCLMHCGNILFPCGCTSCACVISISVITTGGAGLVTTGLYSLYTPLFILQEASKNSTISGMSQDDVDEENAIISGVLIGFGALMVLLMTLLVIMRMTCSSRYKDVQKDHAKLNDSDVMASYGSISDAV
ncbi:uncharacterized protein [Amphiura filiformis]|uniref:uncharacterized protein n=1 Tax=Amphiura filiformis TaxID=82378 RepID=UPI003B214B6C